MSNHFVKTRIFRSIPIKTTYNHSPYMGQHLYLNATKGPNFITVPPASTTGWIEVGGAMDVFNHGSWPLACSALAAWRVDSNVTQCAESVRALCPVLGPDGVPNVTRCTACITALAETTTCEREHPVCVDTRSINPADGRSGNCTAVSMKAACIPPKTPQELQCIAAVTAHCAQNTTHGHPPYAPNATKCYRCALASCPAACNVTVKTPIYPRIGCQAAWLTAGCSSMRPPPPKPKPARPKPPAVIGPSGCSITVGAKRNPFDPADTAVDPLPGVLPFDPTTTGLEMVFSWSTRASRQMRRNQDDFNTIWSQLEAQGTVPGSPPKLVPFYAGTFSNGSDVSNGGTGPARDGYARKQQQFQDMFCDRGNSCLCRDNCFKPGSTNMYADVRETNITKLIVDNPAAFKAITTVSLGDEISIIGHGNTSTFQAWCQKQSVSLKDLDCSGWTHCPFSPAFANASTTPALYYYSTVFQHSTGIAKLKVETDHLISIMAGAGNKGVKFGANFAPQAYYIDPRTGKQACQNYLGWTYQWVRAFREGALTLPWAEDWIWQSPVGSQQVMTLSIEALRSGMYWVGEPAEVPRELCDSTWNVATGAYSRLVAAPKHVDMLMYVMKHFPGNTNNSWTRQLFGDLAHGVNRFDLFLFEPSTSGYTCDYVDSDGGAYPAVRAGTNMVGTFEDIVAAGARVGASVAVLYSETADIWLSSTGTYSSELRSLYIALKHAQLPVDVVIEEDCIAGRLHYYDVLYVTTPHISDAAAAGIAAWVEAGGTVFVTSGGGLRNQANQTNVAMETLLGIKQQVPSANTGTQGTFNGTVFFTRQDLNFVENLDNVSVTNATAHTLASHSGFSGAADPSVTLVVKGSKSLFSVVPSTGQEVLATFADGSPATVRTPKGRGMAYYSGFLPGLSYFEGAIPLLPVDRGSTDENMNHLVVTEFSTLARDLITLPLAGRLDDPSVVPVRASNPLVEVGVLTAPGKGTALPCINWAGSPIAGFNVTLNAPIAFKTATLASGGKLTQQPGGKGFTFDLRVTADVIILR